MQRNIRTQLDDNSRQEAWDKDVFVHGSPGTDDSTNTEAAPAIGEYVTLSGPYAPGTLEVVGTDGTVYEEGTDFYADPETGTWQNLDIPAGTSVTVTYSPDYEALPGYVTEEELADALAGVARGYAVPVASAGELVFDDTGDVVMTVTESP